MARLLPATVVACAAAAAFAAAAFVTLPGSRPSAGAPQLRKPRASPAAEPEALDFSSAADPAAAQPAAEDTSPWKWLSAGLLAGVVLAAYSQPAHALGREGVAIEKGFDITQFSVKNAKHLELCSKNKKYNKRWKDKFYKLDKMTKKYPKDTAVYNRLQKRKMNFERRKASYDERICAKADGIPAAISNGEFVRGGVIPSSLAFLYTTGWIGWAGRTYIRRKAGRDQEIKIDVPLALTCMASGFAWPVYAWQEIVNGEMTVKDADLYDSSCTNSFYDNRTNTRD